MVSADALGLVIHGEWRSLSSSIAHIPRRPFSTLYLFGRGQDIGFQRPIDGSPRKRHHVRFWAVPGGEGAQALDSVSFWLPTPAPDEHERVIWIGAATKGRGFSLTWLSFQITHATDADTNAERDFIIEEFVAAQPDQQRAGSPPGRAAHDRACQSLCHRW